MCKQIIIETQLYRISYLGTISLWFRAFVMNKFEAKVAIMGRRLFLCGPICVHAKRSTSTPPQPPTVGTLCVFDFNEAQSRVSNTMLKCVFFFVRYTIVCESWGAKTFKTIWQEPSRCEGTKNFGCVCMTRMCANVAHTLAYTCICCANAFACQSCVFSLICRFVGRLLCAFVCRVFVVAPRWVLIRARESGECLCVQA